MKHRVTLFAALIAVAACGGGDGPSEPGGGGGGGLPDMTAKIDGVTWSPSIAITAVNPSPGLYSITATRTSGSNNYTMVFALHNITGPGTYPLGVTPSVFGGTVGLSRPPADGWSTPLNGVAGEINITTLTATRLVATFHFDTSPILPNSPGAPKVTEGTIDIPVSGTGGVALANQGSKFTGNIGGAFAASATAVIVTPTAGGGGGSTMSLTGSNGTRSLTVILSNMNGVGSYPLSNVLPLRTMSVSGAPGNIQATWSSQSAGGIGAVNITTFSTTRIVGSFTATLVPLAGGASGNLTVSADFDMARPAF